MNVSGYKQFKSGLYCRFMIWWFCLALLIPAFVAHSAAHRTAITIAISVTPLSAPIIIASEQGYFAEQGVDITFKKHIGGVRTAKA